MLGTSKIISVRETSPDALTDHVTREITQVLDIDDCRFVMGAGPGPQEASIDHDGFVTRRGARVDVGAALTHAD